MLKEMPKIIDEDSNKFITSLYNVYGLGLFLPFAYLFLLSCLTPDLAAKNGSYLPSGFNLVLSGVNFWAYLDLERSENIHPDVIAQVNDE